MLHAQYIKRREAQRWIRRHHSTNDAPVADIFRVAAVVLEGAPRIVGVATVGRPTARLLDDGWTAEVTRVCTNGYPNACSFLYTRAYKVAKLMGFVRVFTMTRTNEEAAALRATGWKRRRDGQGAPIVTRGRSWDTPSRPRSTYTSTDGNMVDKHTWLAPGTSWETPDARASVPPHIHTPILDLFTHA